MFNRRQYSILSERYFEALLGDGLALLWMVGQAPILAGLIILRWQALQATETLYFVIVLSALWFGCINACREIARESAIYKREALFGLNIWSYLASKVKILSLIGLVEIGLFYALLNHYLVVDLIMIPAFVALFLSYVSGMCLGLMLSRWCRTVNKAVVSVPIVIMPQIVFSKFVLPAHTLNGIALKFEKIMIAKWSFEAITACTKSGFNYQRYLTASIVLILLGVLFLLLTIFHFWFVKEEA